MRNDGGRADPELVWTLLVVFVVACGFALWGGSWFEAHHLYARCAHIFHALERWAARH